MIIDSEGSSRPRRAWSGQAQGYVRVRCAAWAQKEFSVGHRDRAGERTRRGETTGRLLDYCRVLYQDRARHGN